MSWSELLIQDLRYGVRTLKRNPGFASVAILTLALGIGANTAVFSLLYAIELRVLPVHDPQQLVLLQWTTNKPANWRSYSGYTGCDTDNLGAVSAGCSFTYPIFDYFRSHSRTFEGFAAVAGPADVQARIRGEIVRTSAQFVSGDFFPLLGVHAQYGRMLDLKDDLPGAEAVTVLSARYWGTHFASDPAVIGKTVAIEGVPFIVAGIAPREFVGLQPVAVPDLWIPVHSGSKLGQGWWRSLGVDNAWLYIIGRLKPAARQVEARGELRVLLGQAPGASQGFKPDAQTSIAAVGIAHGLAGMRRMYSEPLHVIMAVMGLVLLIACANLTHLLLARASVRRKEMSVRLAIGCSRARIVRQLLTESMLLSVLGSAAGFVLAIWLSRVLGAFLASQSQSRMLLDVHPDPAVLAFTVGITAFTALLLGLGPALASTRVEPGMALKAGAGIAGDFTSGMGTRSRFRRILVAGEMALALILLIGAGLFVRTLVNLQTLDPGFRKDHLLTFQVSRPHDVEADRLVPGMNAELRTRLAALPGVQSASWSSDMLLIGNLSRASIRLEGRDDLGQIPVDNLRIGPYFFETMGIPVVAGRAVRPEDCRSDVAAVWINRAFAQKYLPHGNPLGRVVVSGKGKYEIAGIAGDAKYQTLRSAINPALYVPSRGGAVFLLRIASDAGTPESAIRRTMQEAAPNLIVENVKTQAAYVDEQLFAERMMARLSTAFGLLALAMAAIGIYGVMAFSIVHRTAEIAIRMTLGAMPGGIVRLVLADGLVPVLAGAAAGLIGAWGLTRLISTFLFGVKPLDGLTYALATLLLLLIAALACYIPARNATRLDPVIALRYE